jgi:Family of unknown function (DUF5723)
MMFKRFSTTALLAILLATPMLAQHELGLNFMRDVWQSNKTNPAIVQPNAFTLSVIGLRNDLSFDGPTYNQIVTRQNGKSVIDVDRFINYLQPENLIRDDLEISTLELAFRIKGLTLILGHAMKYNAFLKYPKALPQMVWQGNAQFIGETVELGNELQLTGYQELGIGAAYKSGNLTFGVKAKLLSGIADASTDRDRNSATLFTSPDVYQITLGADYILNTSNSLDYNSYTDLNADFNFGNFTFDRFFSANTGLAWDLGARLELGKLDIAVSVLDLGQINWDDNVTNYRATQSYEYDGLDFSQALTGGESANFDQALDTLEQLFQPEKTNIGYSTTLPRKVYLNALYTLNDMLSVGGLIFYEKFRGESVMAVAVGANVKLISALTVGATYGVKKGSYDNLGLNLTVNLGPIQIFGVTDNIIAAFNPGGSQSFGARIGGSLNFGKSDEGE